MPEQSEELPNWFRKVSNVAFHCSFGIVFLFLAFKVGYINRDLDKDALSVINIVLIMLGIPSIILSGPRIVKELKKIKYDDRE